MNTRIHVRSPWLLAWLMLVGLCLPQFLRAAPPYNLTYQLTASGRVSMNIYDAGGQVVRELLHEDVEVAGQHTQVWDGNDKMGNPVANPDTCTWKLLETPSGLHAKYLQSLATFPFPPTPVWLAGAQNCAGVGDHIGPRSVAVDATGIYMGVGISEGCPNAIKMGLDGSFIWEGWQPEAWMGRYAMSSMDGTLYQLEQDAYVFAQGTNTPNINYESVGNRPDCSANYVGFYWDCLWPGDSRSSTNVDALGMDMNAYDCGSAIGQQLVVSYAAHSAVCWFTPMPNGGNNSTVGPIPNPALCTVTVPAPKGVAIDNAGDVLVTSGTSVIVIAYGTHTQSTLITGLTAPSKIAVDHSPTGKFCSRRQQAAQTVYRRWSTCRRLPDLWRRRRRPDGLVQPEQLFQHYLALRRSEYRRRIVPDGRRQRGDRWLGGVRRLVHLARNGSIINQSFAAHPGVPMPR